MLCLCAVCEAQDVLQPLILIRTLNIPEVYIPRRTIYAHFYIALNKLLIS